MRLCWLSHSGSGEGLGSQEIRCQSRKAAPGPFLVPEQLASEPSDHPDDIHRGRGQHLLEVRACQTNIATLAQIKATHRLGERTFHAGPQGILRTKLRGLLPLARGLERLVVHLGLHRELAGCLGGGGTCLAGGAGTTGRPVKPDAED